MINSVFKENTKLKVIVGFGSAFIVMTCAFIIAFSSFRDLMKSINYLAEPDDKVARFNTVLTNIAVTENSFRAYILSRDKKYLKEYQNYFKSVQTALDTLEVVTDNASHRQQIKKVGYLWQQKKKDLNQLMKLSFNRSREDEEKNSLKDFSKITRDTTRIITHTIRTTTVITPVTTPKNKVNPKEKEGFFSSIKKIFKKDPDKTPVAEVPKNNTGPVTDTSTIATTKVDSAFSKLVRRLTLLNKQEQYLSTLTSRRELELLDKNRQLLDNITGILLTLRKEEFHASSKNVAKAKDVADNSTKIIIWLACFGLISTLLFIYLILRDITRSNYYRRQLEASTANAEKLAKVKEEFLANMSHEIRTPLNSIIGFVEQLSDTTLHNHQQLYVEAIQNSSHHLLAIVNDILDFSKIESGKYRLESIPFDLENVLCEVCNASLLNAREKGIELLCDFKNLPVNPLVGDPLRLKQILINLISNAIKFTPEGKVVLEAECKEFKDKDSASVTLKVRDYGIGIPRDKMEKIFEGFSQADESMTRKFGGTGLGLSICRKLTELQGGNIFVESEVGHGSVFTVQLSYILSKENIPLNVEDKGKFGSSILSGRKILIVEDDYLNVLLLKTILKKYGAEVLHFGNVTDVLHHREVENSAIILTDLHMPEMNGLDLLDKLRVHENEKIRQIPVVLITANILLEQPVTPQNRYFSGYIVKPFEERVLLETIMTILPKEDAIIVSGYKDTGTITNDKNYSLEDFYKFSDNDPDAFNTLLQVLVEQSKQDLEALNDHWKKGHWGEVYEIAHKITSTFGHLRAESITTKLRKVQKLIKEGNKENQVGVLLVAITSEAYFVLESIQKDCMLETDGQKT